jgi:hypothetical protein
MLDREVRDAAPGVHGRSAVLVPAQEGAGGAGVQAGPAAPAVVGLERQIELQIGSQEKHPQEEVGALPGVQDHGVPAEPPQSGPPGQLSLEDRPRVHVGPGRDLRAHLVLDPPVDPPQPLLHHPVVVPPPGVAGDDSPGRISRDALGVGLVVAVGHHQHGADLGEREGKVLPPGHRVGPGQVDHLSVEVPLEPPFKEVPVLRGIGPADSRQVEPLLPGDFLQPRGQAGRVYPHDADSAFPPE